VFAVGGFVVVPFLQPLAGIGVVVAGGAAARTAGGTGREPALATVRPGSGIARREKEVRS
jgi:hypothetical protein